MFTPMACFDVVFSLSSSSIFRGILWGQYCQKCGAVLKPWRSLFFFQLQEAPLFRRRIRLGTTFDKSATTLRAQESAFRRPLRVSSLMVKAINKSRACDQRAEQGKRP